MVCPQSKKSLVESGCVKVPKCIYTRYLGSIFRRME